MQIIRRHLKKRIQLINTRCFAKSDQGATQDVKKTGLLTPNGQLLCNNNKVQVQKQIEVQNPVTTLFQDEMHRNQFEQRKTMFQSEKPNRIFNYKYNESQNYVLRILLTGGPCAGKTSALTRVVQTGVQNGFDIFALPEAATMIMNIGAEPPLDDSEKLFEWQRQLFLLQLKNEKVFTKLASIRDRPTILMCDRGLLDGKAFTNPSDWRRLLESVGYTEQQIFKRYDLVLHLNTTAKSHKELYSDENNKFRKENAEEAIQIDTKLLRAYFYHDNISVLNGTSSIEEKLNKVDENVHKLIYRYLKKSFQVFDRDNDAILSKDEIKSILQKMCVEYTDENIDKLFEEADTGKTGVIDFDEFVQFISKY